MADLILSPESWTQTLPLDSIFPDSRPLEVDLGCGKGRFLAARAHESPDTNFIGIDRQLRRLRKVGKKLASQELKNVRLLRIEASYAIAYLFPLHSVSVLYVFFPDPWPKKRHHKRRLFNDAFLGQLKQTLTPDGKIHIATDHQQYFSVIRELFEADTGFQVIETYQPDPEAQTEFERIFLAQGAPIGRCSYQRA